MSDSINEQRENAVEAAERAIREELHAISDAHIYNVDAIIRRYAVAAVSAHVRTEAVPAAPSVSTDIADERRADVKAKAIEVLSKHFHGGQWDDVAELIAEAVHPKGAER